jgi:hypothetical protein
MFWLMFKSAVKSPMMPKLIAPLAVSTMTKAVATSVAPASVRLPKVIAPVFVKLDPLSVQSVALVIATLAYPV